MLSHAEWVQTTKSGDFTYYIGSNQSFENLKQCHIKKIVCSKASSLNNYMFPASIRWESGGSLSAKAPSVYKIYSGVLSGESDLKTVKIPYSIGTIGIPCFKGCVNLTSIAIVNATGTIENPSPISLYDRQYSSKEGVLYDLGYTILLKYPEGKTGTSFTVPSTVTKLSESSLCNTKLSAVYFQSDAPAYANDSFTGSNFTIYYPQGKSGWTNPFNGRPAYAIPTAVNGLTSEIDASSDHVYLYWNPNSIATSYVIYRATSANGAKVQLATTSSCFYTDTTATPGTTYWYYVSAKNNSCEGSVGTAVQGRRKLLTYVVTYYPGSYASESESQSYIKSHDVSLTLLGASFTRTGYTQIGWVKNEGESQSYAFGETYAENASLALYPVWEANCFSIAFNKNEGAGTMDNQSFVYDEIKPLALNAYTRNSYSFLGWSTEVDGNVVYEDGAVVSNLTTQKNGVVDLYAIWEKIVVATPTISPLDGTSFKTDSCKITLCCATSGSTIYYSTDGTSPRALEAFKYTGPFSVMCTTTIKAFAVKDDVKSGLLTAVISKIDAAPATFEDALVATNIGPIMTGGDGNWIANYDNSAPRGEVTVRSGVIGDSATTYMETKVKGNGTLTFWWKTSCEPDEWGEYTYDHVALVVDEMPTNYKLDGESGWQQVSYTLTDGGEHSVRWVYSTDAYTVSGYENCVWINGVTWNGEDWPTLNDPIPDIGDSPSAAAVAAVVADAMDPKVSVNIDETNYNNFRTWAGLVKRIDGTTLGAQGVMNADNAWMSYALGQSTLLETAPTDNDLLVEAFEPTAKVGKFDFTVSVKNVEVGNEAAKEDLKKVFGLEGATTLAPTAFSPDKVDIEFGTPVDGKVRFTATPKDTSSDSFFMKVKILP